MKTARERNTDSKGVLSYYEETNPNLYNVLKNSDVVEELETTRQADIQLHQLKKKRGQVPNTPAVSASTTTGAPSSSSVPQSGATLPQPPSASARQTPKYAKNLEELGRTASFRDNNYNQAPNPNLDKSYKELEEFNNNLSKYSGVNYELNQSDYEAHQLGKDRGKRGQIRELHINQAAQAEKAIPEQLATAREQYTKLVEQINGSTLSSSEKKKRLNSAKKEMDGIESDAQKRLQAFNDPFYKEQKDIVLAIQDLRKINIGTFDGKTFHFGDTEKAKQEFEEKAGKYGLRFIQHAKSKGQLQDVDEQQIIEAFTNGNSVWDNIKEIFADTDKEKFERSFPDFANEMEQKKRVIDVADTFRKNRGDKVSIDELSWKNNTEGWSGVFQDVESALLRGVGQTFGQGKTRQWVQGGMQVITDAAIHPMQWLDTVKRYFNGEDITKYGSDELINLVTADFYKQGQAGKNVEATSLGTANNMTKNITMSGAELVANLRFGGLRAGGAMATATQRPAATMANFASKFKKGSFGNRMFDVMSRKLPSRAAFATAQDMTDDIALKFATDGTITSGRRNMLAAIESTDAGKQYLQVIKAMTPEGIAQERIANMALTFAYSDILRQVGDGYSTEDAVKALANGAVFGATNEVFMKYFEKIASNIAKGHNAFNQKFNGKPIGYNVDYYSKLAAGARALSNPFGNVAQGFYSAAIEGQDYGYKQAMQDLVIGSFFGVRDHQQYTGDNYGKMYRQEVQEYLRKVKAGIYSPLDVAIESSQVGEDLAMASQKEQVTVPVKEAINEEIKTEDIGAEFDGDNEGPIMDSPFTLNKPQQQVKEEITVDKVLEPVIEETMSPSELFGKTELSIDEAIGTLDLDERSVAALRGISNLLEGTKIKVVPYDSESEQADSWIMSYSPSENTVYINDRPDGKNMTKAQITKRLGEELMHAYDYKVLSEVTKNGNPTRAARSRKKELETMRKNFLSQLNGQAFDLSRDSEYYRDWLQRNAVEDSDIMFNAFHEEIEYYSGSQDNLRDITEFSAAMFNSASALYTLLRDAANVNQLSPLGVLKDAIGKRLGNEAADILSEGISKVKEGAKEITGTVTGLPEDVQGTFNIPSTSTKKDNRLEYSFQAEEKILKNINSIRGWERNKSIDQNTLWDKIQKLGIAKDEIELIKEQKGQTVEEKLNSFVENYSFPVEVITAKEQNKDYKMVDLGDGNFEPEPIIPDYDYQEVLDEEGNVIDMQPVLTEKGKQQLAEMENTKPTQYYAILSVPGGINYTENRIATPNIIPSIKGHAEFAKDNDIGWFRSDDKAESGFAGERTYWNPDTNREEFFIDYDDTKATTDSKTRRILEIQSDLFQKGRDKSQLTGREEADERKREAFEEQAREENWTKEKWDSIMSALPINEKQNQFLQLLNKNNNWVTFFIKSIIQDSAKKGYEKVLFPSGNTATKVEGHTTLEEFKREKEDRIKELEKFQEKHKDFVNVFGSVEEQEIEDKLKDAHNEIKQLKQELERVEREGFRALSPIFNFYENTISNILKKQRYNPTVVTDEFGNSWNEVTIEKPVAQTGLPSDAQGTAPFVIRAGLDRNPRKTDIGTDLLKKATRINNMSNGYKNPEEYLAKLVERAKEDETWEGLTDEEKMDVMYNIGIEDAFGEQKKSVFDKQAFQNENVRDFLREHEGLDKEAPAYNAVMQAIKAKPSIRQYFDSADTQSFEQELFDYVKVRSAMNGTVVSPEDMAVEARKLWRKQHNSQEFAVFDKEGNFVENRQDKALVAFNRLAQRLFEEQYMRYASFEHGTDGKNIDSPQTKWSKSNPFAKPIVVDTEVLTDTDAVDLTNKFLQNGIYLLPKGARGFMGFDMRSLTEPIRQAFINGDIEGAQKRLREHENYHVWKMLDSDSTWRVGGKPKNIGAMSNYFDMSLLLAKAKDMLDGRDGTIKDLVEVMYKHLQQPKGKDTKIRQTIDEMKDKEEVLQRLNDIVGKLKEEVLVNIDGREVPFYAFRNLKNELEKKLEKAVYQEISDLRTEETPLASFLDDADAIRSKFIQDQLTHISDMSFRWFVDPTYSQSLQKGTGKISKFGDKYWGVVTQLKAYSTFKRPSDVIYTAGKQYESWQEADWKAAGITFDSEGNMQQKWLVIDADVLSDMGIESDVINTLIKKNADGASFYVNSLTRDIESDMMQYPSKASSIKPAYVNYDGSMTVFKTMTHDNLLFPEGPMNEYELALHDFAETLRLKGISRVIVNSGAKLKGSFRYRNDGKYVYDNKNVLVGMVQGDKINTEGVKEQYQADLLNAITGGEIAPYLLHTVPMTGENGYSLLQGSQSKKVTKRSFGIDSLIHRVDGMFNSALAPLTSLYGNNWSKLNGIVNAAKYIISGEGNTRKEDIDNLISNLTKRAQQLIESGVEVVDPTPTSLVRDLNSARNVDGEYDINRLNAIRELYNVGLSKYINEATEYAFDNYGKNTVKAIGLVMQPFTGSIADMERISVFDTNGAQDFYDKMSEAQLLKVYQSEFGYIPELMTREDIVKQLVGQSADNAFNYQEAAITLYTKDGIRIASAGELGKTMSQPIVIGQDDYNVIKVHMDSEYPGRYLGLNGLKVFLNVSPKDSPESYMPLTIVGVGQHSTGMRLVGEATTDFTGTDFDGDNRGLMLPSKEWGNDLVSSIDNFNKFHQNMVDIGIASGKYKKAELSAMAKSGNTDGSFNKSFILADGSTPNMADINNNPFMTGYYNSALEVNTGMDSGVSMIDRIGTFIQDVKLHKSPYEYYDKRLKSKVVFKLSPTITTNLQVLKQLGVVDKNTPSTLDYNDLMYGSIVESYNGKKYSKLTMQEKEWLHEIVNYRISKFSNSTFAGKVRNLKKDYAKVEQNTQTSSRLKDSINSLVEDASPSVKGIATQVYNNFNKLKRAGKLALTANLMFDVKKSQYNVEDIAAMKIGDIAAENTLVKDWLTKSKPSFVASTPAGEIKTIGKGDRSFMLKFIPYTENNTAEIRIEDFIGETGQVTEKGLEFLRSIPDQFFAEFYVGKDEITDNVRMIPFYNNSSFAVHLQQMDKRLAGKVVANFAKGYESKTRSADKIAGDILLKAYSDPKTVKKYTLINLINELRENGIEPQMYNGEVLTEALLNKIQEQSYAPTVKTGSNPLYSWAKKSDNSYEVSSEGDKRFSALFAKLKDGRTIEEAYQLDIKGFRSQGDNWKLGKGKPPIKNIIQEQQWNEYKNLWRTYLNENPKLKEELKQKAKGKVLTDKFANTDISQARALAEILNENTNLSTSNPLKNFGFKPEEMNGNRAKDIEMAEIANKFIGFQSGNANVSSTRDYAVAWGNAANSNDYSANDTVMVSASGTWRGVTANQIQETFQNKYKPLLDQAINAGSKFVVGSAYSKGNLGDKLVADYLQSKGYKPTKKDGYNLWIAESSSTTFTLPQDAQGTFFVRGVSAKMDYSNLKDEAERRLGRSISFSNIDEIKEFTNTVKGIADEYLKDKADEKALGSMMRLFNPMVADEFERYATDGTINNPVQAELAMAAYYNQAAKSIEVINASKLNQDGFRGMLTRFKANQMFMVRDQEALVNTVAADVRGYTGDEVIAMNTVVKFVNNAEDQNGSEFVVEPQPVMLRNLTNKEFDMQNFAVAESKNYVDYVRPHTLIHHKSNTVDNIIKQGEKMINNFNTPQAKEGIRKIHRAVKEGNEIPITFDIAEGTYDGVTMPDSRFSVKANNATIPSLSLSDININDHITRLAESLFSDPTLQDGAKMLIAAKLNDMAIGIVHGSIAGDIDYWHNTKAKNNDVPYRKETSKHIDNVVQELTNSFNDKLNGEIYGTLNEMADARTIDGKANKASVAERVNRFLRNNLDDAVYTEIGRTVYNGEGQDEEVLASRVRRRMERIVERYTSQNKVQQSYYEKYSDKGAEFDLEYMGNNEIVDLMYAIGDGVNGFVDYSADIWKERRKNMHQDFQVGIDNSFLSAYLREPNKNEIAHNNIAQMLQSGQTRGVLINKRENLHNIRTESKATFDSGDNVHIDNSVGNIANITFYNADGEQKTSQGLYLGIVNRPIVDSEGTNIGYEPTIVLTNENRQSVHLIGLNNVATWQSGIHTDIIGSAENSRQENLKEFMKANNDTILSFVLNNPRKAVLSEDGTATVYSPKLYHKVPDELLEANRSSLLQRAVNFGWETSAFMSRMGYLGGTAAVSVIPAMIASVATGNAVPAAMALAKTISKPLMNSLGNYTSSIRAAFQKHGFGSLAYLRDNKNDADYAKYVQNTETQRLNSNNTMSSTLGSGEQGLNQYVGSDQQNKRLYAPFVNWWENATVNKKSMPSIREVLENDPDLAAARLRAIEAIEAEEGNIQSKRDSNNEMYEIIDTELKDVNSRIKFLKDVLSVENPEDIFTKEAQTIENDKMGAAKEMKGLIEQKKSLQTQRKRLDMEMKSLNNIGDIVNITDEIGGTLGAIIAEKGYQASVVKDQDGNLRVEMIDKYGNTLNDIEVGRLKFIEALTYATQLFGWQLSSEATGLRLSTLMAARALHADNPTLASKASNKILVQDQINRLASLAAGVYIKSVNEKNPMGASMTIFSHFQRDMAAYTMYDLPQKIRMFNQLLDIVGQDTDGLARIKRYFKKYDINVDELKITNPMKQFSRNFMINAGRLAMTVAGNFILGSAFNSLSNMIIGDDEEEARKKQGLPGWLLKQRIDTEEFMRLAGMNDSMFNAMSFIVTAGLMAGDLMGMDIMEDMTEGKKTSTIKGLGRGLEQGPRAMNLGAYQSKVTDALMLSLMYSYISLKNPEESSKFEENANDYLFTQLINKSSVAIPLTGPLAPAAAVGQMTAQLAERANK